MSLCGTAHPLQSLLFFFVFFCVCECVKGTLAEALERLVLQWETNASLSLCVFVCVQDTLAEALERILVLEQEKNAWKNASVRNSELKELEANLVQRVNEKVREPVGGL
jgi:hypothetical protein